VLERSRLIEAYHRRSPTRPAVHEPAAIAWTTWEMSTLTLHPDPDLVASMTDAATAVAFARIENHYFMHGGWFREGQLIDDVGAIRGIPAVIVQGRYDVCTPIMTAWDLHRAWPEADFVVVDDAGHAAPSGHRPRPARRDRPLRCPLRRDRVREPRARGVAWRRWPRSGTAGALAPWRARVVERFLAARSAG
jgi:pimeloyl-ACP methyl ester carboxylesterase